MVRLSSVTGPLSSTPLNGGALAAAVRACCLKSLRPFHPKDLESRVAQLATAPGDDWLRDLQRRLR